MGKRKDTTPSFVVTLKLNTNKKDDKVLNERFFAAFLMQNRLIRHAKKQVTKMKQDKEYRDLLSLNYKLKQQIKDIEQKAVKTTNASSSKLTKDEKKQLKEFKQQLKAVKTTLNILSERYGLTEYAFHEWIKAQQHKYKQYIDSSTAQKIATRVWAATETVLYRKGKSIHFKKFDNFRSVEGKSNTTGIRYRYGKLEWNKLIIQTQQSKDDKYLREAIKHKVKYCRIIRKPMGITYHYYLQLILEGIPPQKHEFINGTAGIDQGTSSEAVFSDNGCILTELTHDCKDIQKQVTRLSRKLDRSRRANNPDNYNKDGTIKKGKKKWVRSKTYKKTQARLKTLRRRNADAVKQSEEVLANDVLCNHGTNIITERMNYKALQAKAKEDVISPTTGRHRSRKRFGKSLSKHAPARFMIMLERKLKYISKTVFYVDTWKFKASQYDHVVGDYNPVSLSTRSKFIGTDRVQRDLYSAYLLYCSKSDTEVDRNLCFEKFSLFLKHQNTCIKELLKDNTKTLSSFGLKGFVT